MEIKNEVDYYQIIKECIIHTVKKHTNMTREYCHIVRIESPMEQGIPDIYVKIKRYEQFWIEAKIFPNQLSSFQKGFFKQCELVGSKAFALSYDRDDKVYMIMRPIQGVGKNLSEIIEYMLGSLLVEAPGEAPSALDNSQKQSRIIIPGRN